MRFSIGKNLISNIAFLPPYCYSVLNHKRWMFLWQHSLPHGTWATDEHDVGPCSYLCYIHLYWLCCYCTHLRSLGKFLLSHLTTNDYVQSFQISFSSLVDPQQNFDSPCDPMRDLCTDMVSSMLKFNPKQGLFLQGPGRLLSLFGLNVFLYTS